MLRYLRLAWRFFSLSAARDMQYRAHFFGTAVSSLAHIGLFLVFIEIVLNQVSAIGTWDRPRMYILYGTFVLVNALAEFAIEPNVSALSESVRRGELDYIFTKPVDAQVFISLRTYRLPALASALTGVVIIIYGALRLPVLPNLSAVVAYLFLLICGLVIIYSLWLISVLYVFKAIRIESIAVFFVPILQFARYPISAYPHLLQGIFRFALPLVFVATVPSEVLANGLHVTFMAEALLAALLCLVAVRLGWLLAIRGYTSASS